MADETVVAAEKPAPKKKAAPKKAVVKSVTRGGDGPLRTVVRS